MLTATISARTQQQTDRVQRLAYDGLEAMRIAETHLKALRDYCAEWEFDGEDRTWTYLEYDFPYWQSALRLLINSMQEKCYGPPTLPERVFKAMASIEHVEERNPPGSEGFTVCLNIAARLFEESRKICECDDFTDLLQASVITLEMINSYADGAMTGQSRNERVIEAILGK